MSELLTLDELRKAAGNLKRIEEFYSIRQSWRGNEEVLEPLRRTTAAAEAMIRAIDPVLEAHGIALTWRGRPGLEQLPVAAFDPTRVVKVAEFIVELGTWFDAHTGADLEPGAGAHLAAAYGSLQAIRDALDKILGTTRPSPRATEGTEPAPGTIPAGGQADAGSVSELQPASSEPSAGFAMPGELAGEAAPGQGRGGRTTDRLVLEDTDQSPLLQTFKGETELTPQARELIHEFLARNGIELEGYQRLKFESEVQRRIERTPHGQLLVLKIGDFDGKPKPFFSYQLKRPPAAT